MTTNGKPMGVGSSFLFVLAAICWLMAMMYVNGFAGIDAHGDRVVGTAYAFFAAFGLICLTWVWLGWLFLMAGGQVVSPAWAGTAALILVPVSGAAALVALYLVSGPYPLWPLATPVAIPPLLAAYLIFLYQPGLRSFAASQRTGIIFWGLVLVLSLAPWPALAGRMARGQKAKEESKSRQAVWEQEEKERKRAEYLPRIQAMSSDARVMDWYELLDPANGVREEALVALRKVPRRQSDIEDMLGYGILAAMALVPELNLEATPALCEGAQAFLKKHAETWRTKPGEQPRAFEMGPYEDAGLEGIRWVAGHGCDCRDAIEGLAAAMRTQGESADRKKYLDGLDQALRSAAAR